MVMEIIVGIIGIAFIALVIFIAVTLKKFHKVLKKTDYVLSEVHHTLRSLSEPSVKLIDHTNELILDVKKKSEPLNVLFHPLYGLKKEWSAGHKGLEKICDLLGYVVEGIQLFSKKR